MRKALITLCFLFAYGPITYAQNENWDFFTNIGEADYVSLTKDKVTITIYPDYSVTLSAKNSDTSHRYISYNMTVSGKGVVEWKDDEIILNISGEYSIPSDYETREDSYRVNVGVIFDRYVTYDEYYTYELSDEHSEFERVYKLNIKNGLASISTNGSDSIGSSSYIYERRYDSRTGDTTKRQDRVSTSVQISGSYTLKTISKQNNQVTATVGDAYGNWTWNEDRTIMTLNSSSKKERLNIMNDGSNIFSLEFQTDLNNPSGLSEAEMNGIGIVTSLVISLDGQPGVTLVFNRKDGNFVYGQYDRFINIFDSNANSLINQLKNANYIMITYNSGDIRKTALFKITGLEALYDAIVRYNQYQKNKLDEELSNTKNNLEEFHESMNEDVVVEEDNIS